MAVLKRYEVEFLNIETDGIKVGDVVTIENEFDKDTRFKSFAVGMVMLPNHEKKLMPLNRTSWGLIASVYGADSKTWIGKGLVYKGMHKIGPSMGKLWEAEK